MNWQRGLILLFVLLLPACSGRDVADPRPKAIPASGGLQQGQSVDASYSSREGLSIRVVTGQGRELLATTAAPPGIPDGSIFSFSSDEIIGLAAVRGDMLEVCLACTGGMLPARLELQAMREQRETSISAPDNRVTDLLVLRSADNFLRLTWTSVNVGDYDHNGEVNVADLIPLARSLGETAPPGSPWDRTNPLYYVDGDGNNSITISDITPIALNLGNSISHFDVRVGGDLLLSVPYSGGKFDQSSGLPPRFELYLPQETVTDPSAVSLMPVGPGGNPAGPASSGPQPLDLAASTSLSDMELLAICSGEDPVAEQLDGGCESLMRLIDPIDDIGSWEPPSSFIPELGTHIFTNLKRDRLCYLEARFLPATDPVDGSANEAGGPGGEGIQRIAYPLRLPEDGHGYEAGIQVRAVDYPGDGVYLDVFADSSIPGRIKPVPARLHPALDRVARDLDLDGDYGDESWLLDSDHNSLSDSLEERLRTDARYFTTSGGQVVGTVQDILPDRGELLLVNAMEYDEDGGEHSHDTLTLRYTEFTEFAQGSAPGGEAPSKLRSAEISAGLMVTATVSVQRITEFGETVNHWAERVVTGEPFALQDTIYIIPSLTSRRPGQIVNVTVYANETAAAFNSLESMTLHVMGAAEVVPGSVNPGIQGGTDEQADGIWELLGPGSVSVDANVYPMGFFNGKFFQNFDVSISPSSSFNLSNASGALFNFDLRIYEPAVVLSGYRYSEPIASYRDAQGNVSDWNSQDDADAVFIELAAPLPAVSLLDIPLEGDGSYFSPYVVSPGVRYRLAVDDEIAGDITSDPNTWYVTDPVDAGQIDYSDPVVEVPLGFSGSFTVHATYPGKLEIPTFLARKLYFRTP